ncbi:sodium/calcium exchanger 1 isoform X2 [Lingula anatina]|uniref:Sodium/calcium exchanger 1 isoform X2 n=1 Tax=Lingula anatina TaxID=7574 RepID=A0A1S3J873_LINAN|nr:sodium/calcium exchanger 1 isoform X2 [Lingula anatina]|eukprot:XP_013406595.1 sodium/calcium exchanger 1 isoform X2 [Lingula anatina]
MECHTKSRMFPWSPVTIMLSVAVMLLAMQTVNAQNNTETGIEGEDPHYDKCLGIRPCKKGNMLPVWQPDENLSSGDKAARAIVYFISLIYTFLGVSIVADRFMGAIEVITSKEKELTVKMANGDTQIVVVRVWNETVSNLTLMALGSSAPEILLSIIEICFNNNFKAGDLGPGTIVGSAAFNLFVIISICVYVVPEGEVRRIKHLRVFFITASWSIFAYLWLYFIIAVITPGEVNLWEAVVTLMFFPLTVISAYIADKKLLPHRFLRKRYRANRGKTMVVQAEGDVELADGKANNVEFKGLEDAGEDVREFERHRKEYIEILRELRKKNPNADMKTLEEMAEYELLNRGPKSRAYYRIQATRKLTGGGNVIKKAKIEKTLHEEAEEKEEEPDDNITRVFFDPGHYTVMENVGKFSITVTRKGGDLSQTLYVDYRTEDGTANAGTDYEHAEGTVIFQTGEVHKQFEVTILDDDIFEEDEHFYVHLSNLRLGDANGMFHSHGQHDQELVKLDTPSTATVMILDDDHAGIFHFAESEMAVVESVGHAEVKVCRSSGARGRVRLPYQITEGTAKLGKDFEEESGVLIFENDEYEKFISVPIIDGEEYEKNVFFSLVLEEPQVVRRGSGKDADVNEVELEDATPIDQMTEDQKIAMLGKPRLGEKIHTVVRIHESQEFKSTVDKLLKKANMAVLIGTSSWKEQVLEAISVSAGDDDDGEGEEKLPSCLDYVMHFLTIFWKLLFACTTPPTDYLGGWAAFVVSILMIGVLTAFITDLASHLGCTIGLQDTVTAISFVALGTSVPDTFASKVATIQDKYADASIGNVTGSNAVNVFLGIGIAWTIAAAVHLARGEPFVVKPGSLGFSVTMFCIFAAVAIAILIIRRRPFVGGELGGPYKFKLPTTVFFVGLWVFYVLLSAFESYCIIPGF